MFLINSVRENASKSKDGAVGCLSLSEMHLSRKVDEPLITLFRTFATSLREDDDDTERVVYAFRMSAIDPECQEMRSW